MTLCNVVSSTATEPYLTTVVLWLRSLAISTENAETKVATDCDLNLAKQTPSHGACGVGVYHDLTLSVQFRAVFQSERDGFNVPVLNAGHHS